MRLWHYQLIPYLPNLQFKGQLRELIAIARDWEEKGATNHLLINRVMDYPKEELVTYFYRYMWEYKDRYGKFPIKKNIEYFESIAPAYRDSSQPLFVDWHDDTYLNICMYNLLEKHLGVGKSRITDEEWARLCEGYRKITGEDFAEDGEFEPIIHAHWIHAATFSKCSYCGYDTSKRQWETKRCPECGAHMDEV